MIGGISTVQISENWKELYDELAERIRAKDDTGVRQVFRELLEAGRPRQEILDEVARLIHGPSKGRSFTNDMEELRWVKPQRSSEPSQSEEHKKPNAWSISPIKGTDRQRLDVSAEKTALGTQITQTGADSAQRTGASSEFIPEPQTSAVSGQPEKPLTDQKAAANVENAVESVEARRGGSFGMPQQIGVTSRYGDLSVPERLALKMQRQTVSSAGEAKQDAPAEVVAVKDRATLAQHGSRAWSRALGTILTRTSVAAAATAGLFVLWSLYGSELQEVSSANVHRALAWLHEISDKNVSSSPDTDKPTEKTGPQQATAVDGRNETPKRAEASVEESTARSPAAAAPGRAVAGIAERQTEPNTGTTSTRATAETAGSISSQVEAPTSQVVERTVLPATTPSPAQQNETDAAQRAQTTGPQIPLIDTGALVGQGDQFLRKSDVASARLLYQRAADAGDGRGALRMGMTFDPVFVPRWRLRRVRADRTQAISWYRRASALGNAEAELRQREVTAQQTRAAARGQRTNHGRLRAVASHKAKSG